MSDDLGMISPYTGKNPDDWVEITRHLIEEHPLATSDLVDVTLSAWAAIFESKIGSKGFTIGTHIFPKPQIMAFLLHELIPLELNVRFPEIWRGDNSSEEKDLVCLTNDRYSIEVKTSSSATGIFGNRSYAQQGSSQKKSKSGYFLAINFEKFRSNGKRPEIRLIRFGWLDKEDWVGQTAQTGQQARLRNDVVRRKLIPLYEPKK